MACSLAAALSRLKSDNTVSLLEGSLMKVRPLRDRVLVERLEEAEQQTIGGIIIPDTAKEKPQQGRVIAAGKGRVNDKGEVFPLDVKEGDTVLFGKYAGSEIKIEGREYLIIREDEILGVTEGVAEMATV
jgi:chaperonin GroES